VRTSFWSHPNQFYRRRITITIQEGDTIHHHQHGIGTVVSIRKRSFSGPDGSKFAKLHFTRNSMTMMVREEDLAETVRKPIAKKTAQEVFEHIGSWKEAVSEQWKPRAAALQKKLDDGSPFALAEVYKTLSMRQKADNLSAADRRQLGQSEARLAEELAMAFGRAEDDVLRQMETSALA
jgi:RNA polymerase-interacting CarD/CdnL/TRCF family regulator